MRRYTKFKKVITKSGNVMWYRGDGMWFGRCSAAEAELAIATGEGVLFDVVKK